MNEVTNPPCHDCAFTPGTEAHADSFPLGILCVIAGSRFHCHVTIETKGMEYYAKNGEPTCAGFTARGAWKFQEWERAAARAIIERICDYVQGDDLLAARLLFPEVL